MFRLRNWRGAESRATFKRLLAFAQFFPRLQSLTRYEGFYKSFSYYCEPLSWLLVLGSLCHSLCALQHPCFFIPALRKRESVSIDRRWSFQACDFHGNAANQCLIVVLDSFSDDIYCVKQKFLRMWLAQVFSGTDDGSRCCFNGTIVIWGT